jgi:hypothetical protein
MNAHRDNQVGVVERGVGCHVGGGPAGLRALPLAVVCRRHSLQVCIRAAADQNDAACVARGLASSSEHNNERSAMHTALQACSQSAGVQQATSLIQT